MGRAAGEAAPKFSTGQPADINGDGMVDTADLGLLIEDFGQMAP